MRGEVRETEIVLMRSAKEAKRHGCEFIYNAKEDDDGNVCVMGAYERFGGDDRIAAFSSSDDMCRAWDAIETGFDAGPRRGHPIRWWNLGRKLRRRLNPREAHT